MFKLLPISMAAGLLCTALGAWAQAAAPASAPGAAAPSAPAQKLDKVTITGSLIKRSDKEPPSLVQTISRDEIQRSGYSTVEELLRANSVIDSGSTGGSISDALSTGFLSGVASNSMRGLGSQSTLTLLNGRRMAPVAILDTNFGRSSVINVNTIPKGAIERVEVLKDGASALYGSDAVAGVINYVLKKSYQGMEAGAQWGGSQGGIGQSRSANVAFGFGDLSTDRYNVWGGLDVFHRDRVTFEQLGRRGDYAGYEEYRRLNASAPRFSPSQVQSFAGNYFTFPKTGAPVYLGMLKPANCTDAQIVGKGVALNTPGLTSRTTYPAGSCLENTDAYGEFIGAQDRVAVSARASWAASESFTLYADLMASETTTVNAGSPRIISSTGARNQASPGLSTVVTPDGRFVTTNTIVLPVGHPDNPTNSLPAAQRQDVQVLYQFRDLDNRTEAKAKTVRASLGLEGSWGEWDVDGALVYSRNENAVTQFNRLRNSLLTQAIAAGSYRFGVINTPEAVASVASDAKLLGEADILAMDLRASREFGRLPGGPMGVALGVEARRETAKATPDENYRSGDFVGLLASTMDGKRQAEALYAELRLPLIPKLELGAAVRAEHYSTFGRNLSGKLNVRWQPTPIMMFRGSMATGFRAPSISQQQAVALAFTSSGTRYYDPLRCDRTGATPKSKAVPEEPRDCDVLNSTGTPGNLAAFTVGNPDLKPETSRSATLGMVLSPSRYLEMSFDAWYFRRQDEIRIFAASDILRAHFADPLAYADRVVRDPASALPGVPGSGKIVGVRRFYDNFSYTATSGLDFDVQVKLPASAAGQFSAKAMGTYVYRLDEQTSAGGAVSDNVGYDGSTSAVPRFKGSVKLDWKKGGASAWIRGNYVDALVNDNTEACLGLTATGTTLERYKYLNSKGMCGRSEEITWDLGMSYSGWKNLVLSASVLNVNGNYGGSTLAESPFTYNGSGSVLGRRYSLNAAYKF